MNRFSRRDFLKVAGAALASSLVPQKLSGLSAGGKPNIILVLCDSLSARHISGYGYPRATTPNLDAFANRSTVFYNHYSGGNFTTTGTASLLTGMFGWNHRALGQGGLVSSKYVRQNPFTLLGSDYHRFVFSQNLWSDRLAGQISDDIDTFLSPTSFSLINNASEKSLFERDRAIASIAMDEFLLPTQKNLPGSLLAGYLNKSSKLRKSSEQQQSLARYSEGTPEVLIEGFRVPYLNETVFDGMYKELTHLSSAASPFFAYFHLFSPHLPYRPRADYMRLFRDEYRPVSKPLHPLSPALEESYVLSRRTLYDKQVAQVDAEFGKLIARLAEDGVLENSYLIFTSDHGELFERGFVGHGFQFMYDGVLQIPLIIHAPGQKTRRDVFAPSGNVDILPTLLSFAGVESMPAMDGRILPGFSSEKEDPDRSLFSTFAVDTPSLASLKKSVIAMRKGRYKLITYLGYETMDQNFELYDLEDDPEELVNEASQNQAVLNAMKEELLESLNTADRPFS